MKFINVPQYEGLKTDAVLQWVRPFNDVFDYLPDGRDMDRMPRAWITNVIYSVVGQPFKDYVNQKIEARNNALI